MYYELLSIEPSDNGYDFIVKLRLRPSWRGRFWGQCEEEASYFGPRPGWVTMDGRAVGRGVQRKLDVIWRRHKPPFDPEGARAWQRFEPQPMATR